MSLVRVAFVDLSPMLTEILKETLAPIPEVEFCDDLRDGPDFLIARAGAFDDEQVVARLYERPRMKVLTVEEHGPDAFLFELRPERVDLGELSRERLADLVREAAQTA